MWYRIAHELGMSVQRCKQETSLDDYNDWVAYFDKLEDDSWKNVTLDHYYLAQIAFEVVHMAASAETTRGMRLKDFLLKLDEPEERKPPADKKAYIHQQKMLFGAIFDAPVPEEA